MQLTVSRELIPLSAPFTITGYTFTDMSVVVARVAERGATGEGEAAGVYYLGDDADCMCVALEAVRHDVEAGIDRAALKRLLPPGGARNALDCALWDLESKRLRQPVWRIAGLERPRPLLTTFTIPANDPGAMAAKAIEYAQAKSLKLKLTGEMPLDAERVRAVRKARPDAWIGVDANQGFTPDTLGEIYEYYPTITEVRVAAGVFAVGFLLFTILLKVSVPIILADSRDEPSTAVGRVPDFRQSRADPVVPT